MAEEVPAVCGVAIAKTSNDLTAVLSGPIHKPEPPGRWPRTYNHTN